MIYLDHHATTPVAPEVVAAMLPYFGERFGNPSSRHHAFGEEAHRAVEEARARVAGLVGAAPEEIVFTSGATESDNLAVRGAARANAERGRHVVTTVLEHPAVLEPCRTLEREGFAVTRVAAGSDGVVAVEAVARAVRADTVLVSVMAANNEIGTLQPIGELGALCRERGILFHSDAVQAIGRTTVSVDAWSVDLMSLSAHKMYGPKGVGALYVRRGRKPRVRLQAQAEGGGQEKGVRSGTLNVPGIVGFGVAARLAADALSGGEPDRIRALRDRLLARLRERISGVQVNGSLEARLSGNLHVSIEGAEAETLLLSLGARIALSAGAACAEAGGKGSHVLRAIGLPDARVYTSLRFGIGRYNTPAEVDAVVDALAEAVKEARSRTSPVRE
ncbi:MAG TPA: cysteine desulfurase family protein [Vicinamibacteria bacterium]|nr:cysteine desulfurase family protein [Vicinamibacteria bacterium]